MRTTTALACSVFASACMAQLGDKHDKETPDAGAPDGTSSAACETKTADITISSAADFDPLPKGCWEVDATLRVTGTGVTALDKLGDLRKVKELRVESTGLTTLAPTSSIEVTGKLAISYNTSLTEIANIKTTNAVTSIVLDSNPALTGLGALDKTTYVTGGVTVRNNAALTAMSLGMVTKIEGDLIVEDNAKLTTLALTSLQSVANLTIRNNDTLTSFGSMTQLRYVHGKLAIEDNAALQSVDATIPAGVILDLGLSVINNPALTNLGNIKKLGPMLSGGAVFGGNTALHWHEVYEVDCCVGTNGFSWDENAPNCNETLSSYHAACETNGNCPYQLYY